MAPTRSAKPKPIVTRQTNRRAVLLEAAARQFIERGYAAATMRDIAADANMQPGSIYYHFKSKAELLAAVHEEGMRQIRSAVLDALDGFEGTPWEKLEAACVAHLTMLLTGGVFFRALMAEMPPEGDPGRAVVVKLRDDYEKIFARLLDAIDLPKGVNRRRLRLMLLGALNWSHSWYRPRRGAVSPETLAREFVGYVRDGLVPSHAGNP